MYLIIEEVAALVIDNGYVLCFSPGASGLCFDVVVKSPRSRSFATPNRPRRQMEPIPMAFHLPPQFPNGASNTTRTMILMICDVVRVCVRPVSPVTTHHELSSVSSTPQNMTPLLAKAIPPTLASDGFPSFAWLGRTLNPRIKSLTKFNSLYCRSSPSPWVNNPPFLAHFGRIHHIQPI